MAKGTQETWASGSPYELYVGRWSRNVAKEFLPWLQLTPGQKWGDVGCGTGALVDIILTEMHPRTIAAAGLRPSPKSQK